MVRELNPEATVVAAPWDQLAGSELVKAIESRDTLKAHMEALKAEHRHHHDDEECDDPECECHHHHHDDDEDEEHEHHHHHHHHGHDADEVFSSWGVETMHRFTEDEIRAKIAKLDDTATYGTVLRAKGVVPAADGGKWIHFDHVPGEVEIRRGAAGLIGRLCVIGSKMNEEALKALFTE
jgi:G3E family GTPase